jgi:hypothetical protein
MVLRRSLGKFDNMKNLIYSLLILTVLCCFASCKKDPAAKFDTTEYVIKAGEHYSNENGYEKANYNELAFTARFDSSAIYKTIDPQNQDDINKLYGFSDNDAGHQQFSARFGWAWVNNALHLYGYVYNNGTRDSKELGTVSIGAENNCSIRVTPTQYIFTLNNKIDSLQRKSTTSTGIGYKLYPYFGGDEVAPHDVRIWIKEMASGGKS